MITRGSSWGADLFRSPTAAAVIEVYRVAAGEFQPPGEMLTDNGRQYTSWRAPAGLRRNCKRTGSRTSNRGPSIP